MDTAANELSVQLPCCTLIPFPMMGVGGPISEEPRQWGSCHHTHRLWLQEWQEEERLLCAQTLVRKCVCFQEGRTRAVRTELSSVRVLKQLQKDFFPNNTYFSLHHPIWPLSHALLSSSHLCPLDRLRRRYAGNLPHVPEGACHGLPTDAAQTAEGFQNFSAHRLISLETRLGAA